MEEVGHARERSRTSRRLGDAIEEGLGRAESSSEESEGRDIIAVTPLTL